MRWRYYLIDRYDNKTRVDQPVGWDSFSLKIKRHAERHGTFRELQGNSFTFYGPAASLLRTEYEQYGVRGNYKLKIDSKCDGAWIEVYLGQIGFDNYKFTCENGCAVQVDLDQLGPLVAFINRFDQKVDLSSLLAFDGVTALDDYNTMVRSVMLPSKAILLRAIGKNVGTQEYIISSDIGFAGGFPAGTGQVQGAINVPFNTVDVNAIKDFKPQTQIDFYNYTQSQEYIPELIYNAPEQDLNCNGTQFTIAFRVKGSFKNLASGSGSHALNLVLKKGTDNFTSSGVTQIQFWVIDGAFGGPVSNTISTTPFDLNYSGTVTLAPGEKLWVDFFLTYTKTTNYTPDVRLQIDPETNFTASVISKCDPSTAKFYLINETASRITESITNGALKVYSEYYGRKDSLPYSFPSNGCGSLKAVTSGLHVRKAKMSDGTEPKLFLSMKEVFESLSAIDNIGIGQEDEDKIRIENWKWFYQESVILRCTKIDKLEKIAQPNEIWSIFKNGYDKWEAEDYNGLDEFLTKREFRTAIEQVQNTLEKVSKWIASGYAFEVTRRKQNDTKDWRFDNEVFVLCTSNIGKYIAGVGAHSFVIIASPDEYTIGDQVHITSSVNNLTTTITNITTQSNGALNITVSGTLTPELITAITVENLTRQLCVTEINNLTGSSNILDPATVYNARISPERNALKWFDRICQCYRNIGNLDKLIFSSGDGNYLATGNLTDASGCKLESGALAENTDISLLTFADPADAKPIMQPERIKYSYPLSFTAYNQVVAAPYGLVFYQCDSESGYGWIDEIEYKAEDGIANFLLIPKTNYA
jgi:hypothetical protein